MKKISTLQAPSAMNPSLSRIARQNRRRGKRAVIPGRFAGDPPPVPPLALSSIRAVPSAAGVS
jgi:hypothetical protein